jgi:hypothetical protein
MRFADLDAVTVDFAAAGMAFAPAPLASALEGLA